jgi:DNA invertase Pin-like site-specific DNA recombinase
VSATAGCGARCASADEPTLAPPMDSNADRRRRQARSCTGVTWAEADEGFEAVYLDGAEDCLAGALANPGGPQRALQDPFNASFALAARSVARAIVSILLRQPLPGLAPLAVRRAGPGRPGEPPGLVQLEHPLTYTELADRFVWNGLLKPYPPGRHRYPGRPELGFVVPQRRRKLSGAPRTHAEPWHANPESYQQRRRVVRQRRRGRGGRQPRLSHHSSTMATDEIRAEIGPPSIDERRMGVGFMYWRLKEHATGFALARLSSDEIRHGEGAMQQVHAIWHLVSRCPELGLGHLVVTTENSGDRRFENRPDLMLLRELILEGRVDALVARSTDRLIRNDFARANLEDLLKTSDTALYLCSLGRRLDWKADKLQWRTEGTFAEMEREAITVRTETGMVTARLAEGKGRPGAYPFGFYWNSEHAEVRVDDEQWDAIVLIHNGYGQLSKNGRRIGLRDLAEELAGGGWPMSVGNVRNILMNPIYVTGEYTVGFRGHRVTAKPINLGDRAIPLQVFQRNQERLRLNKAPNSVNPLGFFALNRVTILHAACMDQRVPHRAKRDAHLPPVQPVLLGRTHANMTRPAYGHSPRSPECCKGWVLGQDVLESAVITELLRLARCRELQEEWRRAERGKSAPPVQMLTREGRVHLETELANLKLRRETLHAEWAESGSELAKAGPAAYLSLIGPLEGQIKRVQRQLKLDGKLTRMADPPKVHGPLRPIARAAELDDDATYAELLERLEQTLTVERPSDPEALAQRAAIITASLSSVLVRDAGEGFTLELRGPLVPPDWRSGGRIGPVASAQHLLGPALPLEKGLHGDSNAKRTDASYPCTTPTSSARTQPTTSTAIPYDRVGAMFWNGELATAEHRSSRCLKNGRRREEPRDDWMPEWISSATAVALPPTRDVEADLETTRSAIRTAAHLMGPDGWFRRSSYCELRQQHAECRALPTWAFLDRARRASGMTWPELVDEACPADRGKRLLASLARPGLSREHLAHAIRRGKLRAERRDGSWVSTREWVDDYLRTARKSPSSTRSVPRSVDAGLLSPRPFGECPSKER